MKTPLSAGIAAVAVLFLAVSVSSEAGQSNRHDLHMAGEASEIAAQGLADRLGVRGPGEESAYLDPFQVVYLSASGVDNNQAVALLSVASGVDLTVDTKHGLLRAGERDAPGLQRVARGYDVSVLCNRFVEYVNRYGREDKDNATLDAMASEYTGRLVAQVMEWSLAMRVEPTAVGHRILVTAPPHVHEKVEELLELLRSDNGGESADLRYEREALEKLRNHQPRINERGAPVARILLNLCREAGVNAAIVHDCADSLHEFETTFVSHEGENTKAAIKRLLSENGCDHVRIVSRFGALIIDAHEFNGGSYRVFELGTLMQQVADAVRQQGTQPRRLEGFSGDIRTRGGIKVIQDAVRDELFEQGFDAELFTLGTRLVVVGGVNIVDAAEKILNELGYNEPDDEASVDDE
jgi:hypothetical protein